MEYLIGFFAGIILGIVLLTVKVKVKVEKKKETPFNWDNLDEIVESYKPVGKDRFFKCEECGGIEFKEGPGGGSFGNFECCNPKCKAKYNNLGPLGIERIK